MFVDTKIIKRLSYIKSLGISHKTIGKNAQTKMPYR